METQLFQVIKRLDLDKEQCFHCTSRWGKHLSATEHDDDSHPHNELCECDKPLLHQTGMDVNGPQTNHVLRFYIAYMAMVMSALVMILYIIDCKTRPYVISVLFCTVVLSAHSIEYYCNNNGARVFSVFISAISQYISNSKNSRRHNTKSMRQFTKKSKVFALISSNLRRKRLSVSDASGETVQLNLDVTSSSLPVEPEKTDPDGSGEIQLGMAYSSAGTDVIRLQLYIDDMRRKLKAFLCPLGSYQIENGDALSSSLYMSIRTVLVCDIWDFTRMCGSMPFIEIHSILSQYICLANCVANKHGGNVEVFLGDAVVLSWTPEKLGFTHSNSAIKAAIEFAMGLRHIQVGDKVGLRCRIGIHTGDLISGTLRVSGRQLRIIDGEAFITASRLESLNKALGSSVLLSDLFSPSQQHSYQTRVHDGAILSSGNKTSQVIELIVPKQKQT